MINYNEILTNFEKLSDSYEEKQSLYIKYAGPDFPNLKWEHINEYGNYINPTNYLYVLFLSQHGMREKKPEYINPTKFNSSEDDIIFYHGFKDFKHAASFLIDDNQFHYGHGALGNGLYLTTNQKLALNNTKAQENDMANQDLVLPFKICSVHGVKASIMEKLGKDGKKGVLFENGNPYGIKPEEIQEYNNLVRFVASIENQDLKRRFSDAVFGIMGENISTLAACLGYDYVSNDLNNNMGREIVVINRGCLEVDHEKALAAVVYSQFDKDDKSSGNNNT